MHPYPCRLAWVLLLLLTGCAGSPAGTPSAPPRPTTVLGTRGATVLAPSPSGGATPDGPAATASRSAAARATTCQGQEVERVVTGFIAAFNRGDQVDLARFFPAKGSDPHDPAHAWYGDPNQLRWFTLVRANPGRGINALNLYTRETLLVYFAERHQQHERMRLVSLTINPAGSTPSAAAINFRVARQANDLPGGIFPGKGGINCAQGTIYLWSQGDPE